MAPTYDSQRLRNLREMDNRLTEAHRHMAAGLSATILAAAGPDGKIPNVRAVREGLRASMWDRVLKPFYIGGGTDALIGAVPQSPFAQLIVDGIERATRIEAERQAAIVRRLVDDADVVAWLTGPVDLAALGLATVPRGTIPPAQLAGVALAPGRDVLGGLRGVDGRIDYDRATAELVKPQGVYDPFHAFVDPAGYRLSDRIWQTSTEVRSRIDRLMTYHIANGTSAVAIAQVVEPFLTPGGRLTKTKTPYGKEGSYSARRLARTEITAAAGRATVNSSIANPFVEGIQWRLSGSHRDFDECDVNANGGPNRDGIYPPAELPKYPNHPHEMCSLLPVAVGSTADLITTLRADIAAARGNLIDAVGVGDAERGLRLQGLLNPARLTRAILEGTLDTTISDAVRKSANRLPEGISSKGSAAAKAKVAEEKRRRAVAEEMARAAAEEAAAEEARLIAIAEAEAERVELERVAAKEAERLYLEKRAAEEARLAEVARLEKIAIEKALADAAAEAERIAAAEAEAERLAEAEAKKEAARIRKVDRARERRHALAAEKAAEAKRVADAAAAKAALEAAEKLAADMAAEAARIAAAEAEAERLAEAEAKKEAARIRKVDRARERRHAAAAKRRADEDEARERERRAAAIEAHKARLAAEAAERAAEAARVAAAEAAEATKAAAKKEAARIRKVEAAKARRHAAAAAKRAAAGGPVVPPGAVGLTPADAAAVADEAKKAKSKLDDLLKREKRIAGEIERGVRSSVDDLVFWRDRITIKEGLRDKISELTGTPPIKFERSLFEIDKEIFDVSSEITSLRALAKAKIILPSESDKLFKLLPMMDRLAAERLASEMEDSLIKSWKPAVAVPAPPPKVLRPVDVIAAEIKVVDLEVERIRAKRLLGEIDTADEAAFMRTRRKDVLDPLWAELKTSKAEDDALAAWKPPAAGTVLKTKAYRAVLSLEGEIKSIEDEVARLGRKARRGETLAPGERDFLDAKDSMLVDLRSDLTKSIEEDKSGLVPALSVGRSTTSRGTHALLVRPETGEMTDLQNRTRDDLKLKGVDPEDALAAFKDLVDNAPMVINTKSNILGFWRAGEERFKSQFETGTSMGANNNQLRANAENRGLGFSRDVHEDRPGRPIYGSMEVLKGAADHYSGGGGGWTWKIKESVRERMTVTMGDSLGPMGSGTQKGTPLTAPDFEGIGSTYGQSALVDYVKSPRKAADKRAFINRISYIEWQCQGQLLLSDVESVSDTHNLFTDADLKWLDDRGIKVTGRKKS